MSAFDKLEYELFAPLSLLTAFPDFAKALEKSESPDWQDERHSIGIEVARAESKHIGYSKHFGNAYLGKRRSEIPRKELESFRGEAVFNKKGILAAVSDSKELYDGDRHIQLAIQKATEKLSLLNSPHFCHFDMNCLYLYITGSIIGNDAQNFLTSYTERAAQYKYRFDHVFLMTFDSLYCFDVLYQNYSEYHFSDEEMSSMDSNTHLLRSASEWDTQTVFLDVLSMIE